MKLHNIISEIKVASILMGPLTVIAIGCTLCAILAVISVVL